jgi:fibronectin-binding autotransporter adhesin
MSDRFFADRHAFRASWLRQMVYAGACYASLFGAATPAHAQSGTWTSTTGGSWDATTNWSGGVIASGTGTVANFSTLDISGVQTVTLDSPRTSGTLLFGDTAGTNGGWTLTGGTLTLAGSSPTINVTGLGNAVVFGSQAATISSAIAGSSGIDKTGTSALVLSGSNSYSGNTTVNGGFLVLNAPGALGNSASVNVSSGALAIGNGITIGAGKSLSNNSNGGGPIGSFGGVTAISGGTGTWAGSLTTGGRIGYENNSLLVFSGSIGGSNPFLIRGLDAAASKTAIDPRYGVLVTGTTNGYTGQTQVASGVLKIGADNALPTTTTLDIRTSLNAGEAAGFDLNGFNQTVASLSSSGITGTTSPTANGSAFLTNSGATMKTFTANQATSGTFHGIITGNLAFTKSGAGNLTLTPFLITANGVGTTGTSTFSGDTLVSAGTLTLGNSNALFGSTFDTASPGTLSLGTLSAATLGGLKNSGTFTLANSGSAFALSVGGNNVSSTFAGRLTGLGSLTKVGSGTFSLTGTGNDYAGTTAVTAGALQLGNGGTTGSITGNVALSNSAGLIFNRSDSLTYSGSITGTGSITKIGPGTLTLSGSNSISGVTTVVGGTLSIASANAFPGAIALDGATLVNTVNTQNFSKTFSSLAVGAGGGVVRSDARLDLNSIIGTGSTGRLTFATMTNVSGVLVIVGGSNSYAGGTRLETGIDLVVDNNNAFGSGMLELAGARIRPRTLSHTLANPTTISALTQFNSGSATVNLTFTGTTLLSGSTQTIQVDNLMTNGEPAAVFANVIGDGGNGFGITKTGAGMLGLGGANTFSGPTTLSAGTLQLRNQAALQNSTLSLSAGGVSFAASVSGNAFTFGGLASSSTAATLALQNSATTAIALTVGGNGASTSYLGALTGPGSLVKTGTGTLTLGGANSYAGTTTVAAGTLQIGAGGTAGTLAADVVNDAAVVFNRSDASSYAGRISGSGAVRQAGAGTLALGGSNSYTGVTTFAAGSLRLDHASALAGGGNLTFAGGALQYSGSNQADYSARIVGSGSAIAIDTNGQSVSFATALAASNTGGLTKLGAGTLVLPTDNLFTGLTRVTGGTLQIGNGGTTGSITGNLAFSNTAAAVFSRSDSFTFAGSLTGTGSLTKLGAGTLTLSGTNTMTGMTTIAGGTLAITSTSSLPTSFTLDGATLVNTVNTANFGKLEVGAFTLGPGGGTIRSDARLDLASITGSGSTASLTLGTMTNVSGVLVVVAGSNSYAGGTRLETGINAVVQNDNAFGTGTLELAGARFRPRFVAHTLANPVTISGATDFDGGLSTTFTGATLLSGSTQRLDVYAVIPGQPTVTFANVIHDDGNGYGITKAGIGVLALGGANTFTGLTTLTNGTLQLQNQAALQNSTLSLSAGGVSFAASVSGNAFTFGGLASSSTAATLALQNSATTAIALTVGGNGASTSYLGALTGPGSLVKTGTGTLTLGGANSYAGTTTVAAGTLLVNGNQAAAAGNVAVDAAGTLGGSGVIGGAVAVAGLLSPGNSPGVLTLASLALDSSATSLFEINATARGTAYDGIDITSGSGLSYGGTLSLVFGNGSALADDTTFDLFSFGGSPAGGFTNVTSSGFYAGTWNQVTSGTWKLESGSQTLTFSQATGDVIIVPEPAAWALAALGIAAAAWARRRASH